MKECTPSLGPCYDAVTQQSIKQSSRNHSTSESELCIQHLCRQPVIALPTQPQLSRFRPSHGLQPQHSPTTLTAQWHTEKPNATPQSPAQHHRGGHRRSPKSLSGTAARSAWLHQTVAPLSDDASVRAPLSHPQLEHASPWKKFGWAFLHDAQGDDAHVVPGWPRQLASQPRL